MSNSLQAFAPEHSYVAMTTGRRCHVGRMLLLSQMFHGLLFMIWFWCGPRPAADSPGVPPPAIQIRLLPPQTMAAAAQPASLAAMQGMRKASKHPLFASRPPAAVADIAQDDGDRGRARAPATAVVEASHQSLAARALADARRLGGQRAALQGLLPERMQLAALARQLASSAGETGAAGSETRFADGRYKVVDGEGRVRCFKEPAEFVYASGGPMVRLAVTTNCP